MNKLPFAATFIAADSQGKDTGDGATENTGQTQSGCDGKSDRGSLSA